MLAKFASGRASGESGSSGSVADAREGLVVSCTDALVRYIQMVFLLLFDFREMVFENPQLLSSVIRKHG